MNFVAKLVLACALFALPALAPGQAFNPELPADARPIRDVSYVSDGHARQKLDLYLPQKPKGPLLVWIHGGGWRGGDKNKPPGLALVGKGFAVASVEWRGRDARHLDGAGYGGPQFTAPANLTLITEFLTRHLTE